MILASVIFSQVLRLNDCNPVQRFDIDIILASLILLQPLRSNVRNHLSMVFLLMIYIMIMWQLIIVLVCLNIQHMIRLQLK
jgi:hypothetical protein